MEMIGHQRPRKTLCFRIRNNFPQPFNKKISGVIIIKAGADRVVGGASLVGALSSVADSMGIPYRFVAFSPSLLPSGHYPNPLCKHQDFPAACNRLSWQIKALVDRFTVTALVNTQRKNLQLKPVKDVWRTFLGKRVIVASDKAVSSVPPDVAQAGVKTGYLHLDQPDQPHEELERFLKAGPPPVYAGFGSMPKKVQMDNVSLIVQAARTAGAIREVLINETMRRKAEKVSSMIDRHESLNNAVREVLN